MEPVDFVVTWVDGSDPEWRAVKDKYSVNDSVVAEVAESGALSNGEERYRDWDFFRYWFRGVEYFAPWVRKIHFVTWGHVPSWLNVEHPKLNVVSHNDFIPECYLPTFSSHTIELNLHRIPGLSEKFVYFNDDMHIVSRVNPNDFFAGDLPRYSAVLNALQPWSDGFYHILGNNLSVINSRFSTRRCWSEWRKWFHYSYRSHILRNLIFLQYQRFVGFLNDHGPSPLTKSLMEKVWSEEHGLLHATCMNKFRTPLDVNQYLFQWWAMAENEFVPIGLAGRTEHWRMQDGTGESVTEKGANFGNSLFAVFFDGDLAGHNQTAPEKLQHLVTDGFLRIMPYPSDFELTP